MVTTTTPEDDDARRRRKIELSSQYGREGTPSGLRSTEIRREDPTPRVIRSTNELLAEILKCPGQYFMVTYTEAGVCTIEFSDRSHILVQSA